ncbi:MAG TPA: ABC transporter permease [Gammaproteobacteria bacterium]
MSLAQDARYAWRTLRKSPAFTLVAVLILALGIGACTAVFSLASAVLLKPLPFAEPDRLVVLWSDFTRVGGSDRGNPSPANYVDWKERSRSFEDMAALVSVSYNLTGAGEPQRLAGIRATGNLFSVLGLDAKLGRTFTPADEAPDALPVAVVSERFWLSRFGGDPGLIGRSITLNGVAHVVVGVVPPDFRFPNPDAAVWVPARFSPEELARRDAYYMFVVARLRAGVPLSAAQAEMTTIAAAVAREHPENAGLGTFVTPLHEHLSRTVRPAVFLLLGAVGVVLLVTCANVANLLLARGASRVKELALRQTLGADRRRMLAQLFTENALLGAAGLLLGMAVAFLAFGYLARLVPETFPAGTRLGLDWRVLAFSGALGVATVLLFGAAPALAAARLDFADALKKGPGRGATATGGGARNALVVAEITLTVVLLAAAGLLLRSYAAVLAADPGFRPQSLLIAETALPQAKYAESSARNSFYESVLERVAAIPGVEAVAYANYVPLTFDGGYAAITIEGRPPWTEEELGGHLVADRAVSPGYFDALGVPLLRGRDFDERDAPGAPLAVIISESLARAHWPDGDPLGQRLKLGPPRSESPWYTVVGIVGDVRQMALDQPPRPQLYFPLAQVPSMFPFLWPQHLLVRAEGDPMALAGAVRAAVWSVDPNQPVAAVRSMEQVFDAQLANRNLQMTLVSGFAALALVLASVGLYSVLSYTVALRTSEIGVRMALGAQRRNVIGAVLRSAAKLAACGVALGIAGAFGIARLLSSFLFGVSPTDALTFTAVPALLLGVALLAAYVPARRAARVDPLEALRAE